MKSEPEKSRKLVLTRETIMPLQDDELATVRGGNSVSLSYIASVSVSLIGRSSRGCAQSSVKCVKAVSDAVSKVTKTTYTTVTTISGPAHPPQPPRGQPPQGGNQPGGGGYPGGYEE
jgi:hypothetical protein